MGDFALRKTESLHGKFINNDVFKFDCGFEIPASQVSNLIFGYCPTVGNEVTFYIKEIKVKKHEHEFKCYCGEVHNDE